MFIGVKVPHETFNIDSLLLGPRISCVNAFFKPLSNEVFCRFHASLIRTLMGHDLSFFNYQALLLAAADTCM